MNKTILFTTPSKRISYLGINLITEVKDLYTDNYKTLMKITEDDTSEKIHCAYGLEELILLKYTYYPEPSIDSVQSLPQFQWHFS